MQEPDFTNLLKVLRRQVPERPVLFELFLNEQLYRKLADERLLSKYGLGPWCYPDHVLISAFKNAGYDYATCYGADITFCPDLPQGGQTISLNAGKVITDQQSLDSCDWPDPDSCDYSRLKDAVDFMPSGMKLIVLGPGGVLENAIALVGFERLCLMLKERPKLAGDVFENIGRRLLRYYQICSAFETVGAFIVNDDWGFKTGTMFSPEDMRRYVFPWHKRIVEVIHQAGKPAILHSCGNLEKVMDDVIDDMKYDAKHSFEDIIEPVEQAYEKYGDRIAILGGIDLDFVCKSTPEQIQKRCRKMLERTGQKGGYALGTGNSVPEYVPEENFFALISTVTDLENR